MDSARLKLPTRFRVIVVDAARMDCLFSKRTSFEPSMTISVWLGIPWDLALLALACELRFPINYAVQAMSSGRKLGLLQDLILIAAAVCLYGFAAPHSKNKPENRR